MTVILYLLKLQIRCVHSQTQIYCYVLYKISNVQGESKIAYFFKILRWSLPGNYLSCGAVLFRTWSTHEYINLRKNIFSGHMVSWQRPSQYFGKSKLFFDSPCTSFCRPFIDQDFESCIDLSTGFILKIHNLDLCEPCNNLIWIVLTDIHKELQSPRRRSHTATSDHTYAHQEQNVIAAITDCTI